MTKRVNRDSAEADCRQAFREREGREPTADELGKALSAYLKGFRETDRAIDQGKSVGNPMGRRR